MEAEIGNAAGMIWQHLDQHGDTTLSKLKLGVKLSDQCLFMGLGWLLREGKVNFAKDRRSLKVSLR
ncbi:MAG: winged helix-turn-helix domain-containing protein [Terriglobia bacterium]